MLRRCILPFALLLTTGCPGLGAHTKEVPPAAMTVLQEGVRESARAAGSVAEQPSSGPQP
jgi:hypothetical protein